MNIKIKEIVLDFNYFHIPTRIIQGYESFGHLSEMADLSKKRVVLVTDEALIGLGITQTLRRFIENTAYGLIPYETSINPRTNYLYDGVNLVRDSRAQIVIGFGNPNVLAVARGMVQLAALPENKIPIHYIEIPTMPGICPGIMDTYYIGDELDQLKHPYYDPESRADWLLLDSSYTEHIRVDIILSHAFQALAYTMDAYLSRSLSLLGESYALRAIEILVSAGNRLPNEPTNTRIKNELMLGGLLGSFAVQSSSLGISAALGMGLEASRICSETQGAGAVFLHALEYSLLPNIAKMQKIVKILDLPDKGDVLENGFLVMETLQELAIQMEIPPLSTFPTTPFLLEKAAKQAARYDFITDLSRPAGFYELTEILQKSEKEGFNLDSKEQANASQENKSPSLA